MPFLKESGYVLSPERSLTKICWVSAAAFPGADVDEALEEDREVRILRLGIVGRWKLGEVLGLELYGKSKG